jgi:hypothetical protein
MAFRRSSVKRQGCCRLGVAFGSTLSAQSTFWALLACPLSYRFGIATTKRRWRLATSTGSEELPRGWGLRPVHLCVLHRRLLHRWLNDIFGGEILDPVVGEVAVAPICGEQWQHGGPFVVFCSWWDFVSSFFIPKVIFATYILYLQHLIRWFFSSAVGMIHEDAAVNHPICGHRRISPGFPPWQATCCTTPSDSDVCTDGELHDCSIASPAEMVKTPSWCIDLCLSGYNQEGLYTPVSFNHCVQFFPHIYIDSFRLKFHYKFHAFLQSCTCPHEAHSDWK